MITMTSTPAKSIAVVGGGVAGLSAAWILEQRHNVTLIEAQSRLGGHTNTITIEEGPDAGTPVDTGFIVCNDRNYENFHIFLERLGCRVRNADMSFGYEDRASGLQYSGASLLGLFASPSHAFRPSHWAMLSQIHKFMKAGREAMAQEAGLEGSLGDFLARTQIGEAAIQHYVLPMGAAIWSAPREKIFAFPARSFLRFFQNHGLLSVSDMPQWQTVIGGSHQYLKAFEAKFGGEIRRGQALKRLRRDNGEVELHFEDGRRARYDAVVLALHADEALALLEDPSEEEARLLGAWEYQENQTVLHRDASLLPSRALARASWNYLREKDSRDDAPVSVTYHMNRLQGLRCHEDYCVTLNLNERIDPKKILRVIHYRHPVFDAKAVASQEFLPRLNGKRQTWYCGSYFGWGFHEDAVKSGVAVGRDFGLDL